MLSCYTETLQCSEVEELRAEVLVWLEEELQLAGHERADGVVRREDESSYR